MKTHLLFTCLFISCAINAQMDIESPLFPPSHPMDTRLGNKPEVRLDSIISKSGTESGVEYIIIDAHYYGDDGYIDTLKTRIDYVDKSIIVCFAYASSISTYSRENNKLVSKDFFSDAKMKVLADQLFYEYDSAGRRIKEHNISYYDQKITHDKTLVYDFSTVNYTDSGYIFNNVNYCFDEKNRLKKEIHDNKITTYSYYNDDSGYDIITTRDGYNDKSERFFNKHGLLKKSIGTRLDLTSPSRKSILELEYYFSPGNATSNSLVTNIPKIYGTTGGLVINTVQPEWINIYTLSGQLVKKEYVNQNQQISLPKGIYIVKSANKTFKVVVK
ncbi:MAG: T9SS type A sorting domain-containing protein [Tannerella sp.]|jgi:hypothetical protein|nr:T9SS type A sorting domain-containing protein [Tannerella sp.]